MPLRQPEAELDYRTDVPGRSTLNGFARWGEKCLVDRWYTRFTDLRSVALCSCFRPGIGPRRKVLPLNFRAWASLSFDPSPSLVLLGMTALVLVA